MATKTTRPTKREIRAIGYRIADDILTIAQGFINNGYSQQDAISFAIRELAGE